MENTGDDDTDNVLSDVEGDDPIPIILDNPSQEDISAEKFREVLGELERERKSRVAAENSKSELQVSFNRLRVLTHEAIKKRDESTRQRDEALREKEEALTLNEKISGELAEVVRLKDEVLKQRDESLRQLEDTVKARDLLRSEIEASAQLLVKGIDKISGKVSNFKNFSAGGLPRSQKYTGLSAVSYGVIKRTNEIAEELLKQLDTSTKSRNDIREQMEQRNYEIAIEVSQLEAAISGLRDEVTKKSSEIENLEKWVSDKDGKISEMDREMLEKRNSAELEASELRRLFNECDHKLRSLESKMDSQRPLLIDQFNYITRIHDQVYEILKMVDPSQSDQSEFSDCLFLPHEMDMDENLRASLAVMESTYSQAKIATERIRDGIEERIVEAKGLNETITRLAKEKQHIGSLLRSALPRKMVSVPSLKTSEVLQVAENGLREAGIDFKISNILGNGENMVSDGKQSSSEEVEQDEVYNLAGALENIVKVSQLEIIELQHSVERLRAETSVLKAHMEAQAKDLSQRKHHIEELEEKERVANESVEGLMMDIAAAEEEIGRWKMAAEQEAAAGKAIEQDIVAQLSVLHQELDETRQALLELEKKLKFKEETAAAALAARDAAEKSLRLADLRATRLGERVEELSRQMEESDTREDLRTRNRQRYMCWPWQWLGLNMVGYQPVEARQQQGSNEMELSEPLL